MSERAELLERLETERHRPVPRYQPAPWVDPDELRELLRLIRKAVSR